eukprot:SAG31_NODE_520_length_14616_cov_8.879005_5_plen_103_part_00
MHWKAGEVEQIAAITLCVPSKLMSCTDHSSGAAVRGCIPGRPLEPSVINLSIGPQRRVRIPRTKLVNLVQVGHGHRENSRLRRKYMYLNLGTNDLASRSTSK